MVVMGIHQQLFLTPSGVKCVNCRDGVLRPYSCNGYYRRRTKKRPQYLLPLSATDVIIIHTILWHPDPFVAVETSNPHI